MRSETRLTDLRLFNELMWKIPYVLGMHPGPVRTEVLWFLLPGDRRELTDALVTLERVGRIKAIEGPRDEEEEARFGSAIVRWELVCPLEKLAYL